MRFFAWLIGALHLERFLIEDNKVTPGLPCACKGKWDKHPETKHGSSYCMRSTTSEV